EFFRETTPGSAETAATWTNSLPKSLPAGNFEDFAEHAAPPPPPSPPLPRRRLGERLFREPLLALHEAAHEAAGEPYQGSEDEHRHRTAHEACEEGGVEGREGEFGELLAAVEHPVPSRVCDERGQDDDADAFRHYVLEQQVERRHQHEQHGKLADFHPDI